MARLEDDLQGDGRSVAGRRACTSDGEQVNWLGIGSAGGGALGISHISEARCSPQRATALAGDPEMWGTRPTNSPRAAHVQYNRC